MGDTKEAILTTALQLFAGNGYEAVSVSEIAGALGMTKGALYKHYKNKRDIFDHILIRMEQRDAEQAGNCAGGNFRRNGRAVSGHFHGTVFYIL